MICSRRWGRRNIDDMEDVLDIIGEYKNIIYGLVLRLRE